MVLSELRSEVYNLTNRPDLVNETLTAIRAATLKLHQMDFFHKDLVETGITWGVPAYLQELEFRTLFPFWRALKYLRKTDVLGSSTGVFFTVITPEQVLDDYKLNRVDVCYAAGSVVQIKSSTQLQYALLGYYANPNITEAGYNSWIAAEHPYAIIFEAASLVFKMIGETDQFAAYTRLAVEQAAMVSMSNIQATGY